MIEKAETVVLRTLNHGDTSMIITSYSREHGRLKLIAKGVRSQKSKALGLFQPTRHLRVIYYSKPHSELQLFKSGELVNGFFGLENDFDRLTLAQVVVELMDRTVEREEPHPNLFTLLVNTLNRLNTTGISPGMTFWYFHLHLLREMGFRPDLGNCVRCNADLDSGAWVGQREPVLECESCHQPTRDSTSVSGDVIRQMQNILDNQWDTIEHIQLSATERRTLWNFLWHYTHYHIEPTRNMRSLKVLKQLYG